MMTHTATDIAAGLFLIIGGAFVAWMWLQAIFAFVSRNDN